ncbi:hypothetical protein [Synechococcus phage Ssp-JY40]
MPNHLTPAEQARLEQIDAIMAPLKAERAAILNRARGRAHYERQKSATKPTVG